MHRKSEEKDAFYAELMIHLTVQSMGGAPAPEGTFDGGYT